MRSVNKISSTAETKDACVKFRRTGRHVSRVCAAVMKQAMVPIEVIDLLFSTPERRHTLPSLFYLRNPFFY
jgi:hypothetical protein